MADKKTLAKRDAHIRTVKTLIGKINDMEENENINEKELNAVLKTLRLKQTLNEDIINIVEEEKILDETERSTDFNIEIDSCLFGIESYLEKFKLNTVGDSQEIHHDELTFERERKNVVKLPKLTIKRFCGDPTSWPEFIDTFTVAIHDNVELTPIEKFTYLKSYTGGEAEKCLEGLTLSSANYNHALEMLAERFGNKQLITSKHMSTLLGLEKVKYSR